MVNMKSIGVIQLMRVKIFLIFLISVFGCKNTPDKAPANQQKSVDNTEIDSVLSQQTLQTFKLISFLENPLDLQNFKAKKMRNVTTSVTNGLYYYYNPAINDSIFYSYNFITDTIGPKGINDIVVFKHGALKHSYDDATEILIDMKISNKDTALEKADLVGVSKTELESEFGKNYQTTVNGMVYAYQNKVLIIELEESQVRSYRYLKLNTDKVDKDLIKRIME